MEVIIIWACYFFILTDRLLAVFGSGFSGHMCILTHSEDYFGRAVCVVNCVRKRWVLQFAHFTVRLLRG